MEGNEESQRDKERKKRKKERKRKRKRERKRKLERRKERTIKEKEIGENERARRYTYISSYIYMCGHNAKKGKYRVWQTSLRNIFFAVKKKKKKIIKCVT